LKAGKRPSFAPPTQLSKQTIQSRFLELQLQELRFEKAIAVVHVKYDAATILSQLFADLGMYIM